ncbi:MAG: penicillin acylase family protein [Candidatus Calescibacterium sp.]|nr:penicillin acylase family protein [Candidatus Calescibacterium sp.]MCX7733823.1 penicillin acylase family protein [bacterium]MDW8086971.1 penicillin acylase family protein [Candidatus Calescibacterium sp.]
MVKALIVFLLLFLCSCGKKDEKSEQIPQNVSKEEIGGTGYNARIFIDKNGLPYVESEKLEDGIFATGYITAKMRYAQIDILRVVSNGFVSSILDVKEANTVDALTIRTILSLKDGKLVNQAQWDLLRQNDPSTAKLLQAFADGINLYIKRLEEGNEELPPEYETPVLSSRNPQKNKGKFYITPAEILAIARFEEWYLTGEGDLAFSIIKSRIRDKVSESAYKVFSEITTARAGVNIFTLPAPLFNSDLGKIYSLSLIPFHLEMFSGARWGSNNFVVSPKIAQKPLVANDPHLPLLNPPLWFPIRAKAGGIYLEGFSLVGIPGILSGTNGSVAWAVTNAGFDSLDLYLEKVKKNNNCPSGFSFVHNQSDDSDDHCVEFVEHSIGSKSKPKVRFYYCKTHGVILGKKNEVLYGDIPVEPVLEDGQEYISFRWNGQEVSAEVFYFLKILEAKSVDEFMKAITGFQVATINFVFADLKGDIGYGTFSLLPDRKWDLHKYPSVEILPTDGCCDWKSWVDIEKYPRTKNPEKGFIVTANNDLPGYTADGDPFNDPVYLFWSYDPGYRIAEMTYMIEQKARQTSNKFYINEAKEVMEDTISYWTRGVFPKIITYITKNESGYNDIQKSALSVLKSWDLTCKSGFKLDDPAELSFSEFSEKSIRINSSGCTIWWVFVTRLIMNTFSDEFQYYLQTKPYPFLEDYFIKNLYFYFVYGRADSDFFDDITTPVKETAEDVIFVSYKQAINYLSDNFGKNPENWLWGKLNKMKLYHPTSQAGISLFDIGPFPIDLGPFSPAVAWISLVTDDPKESFINTGGPSLRSIAIPEGDKFKILFAFPGGAAGFGWSGGEKTLRKPDMENNFNDLISTYFGAEYISFEEDKSKHKKVILILP